MPMLIDRQLPQFDVTHVRAIAVEAPIEDAWDAVRNTDLQHDRLFRTLATLSLLPGRAVALARRTPAPRNRTVQLATAGDPDDGTIVRLGEESEVELVL